MKFSFLPAIIVAASLASFRAEAAALLGNLPQSPGASANVTSAAPRAIIFTMGATSYTLDDVQLNLAVASGAVPQIELWSVVDGNPDARLLSLTTPDFTYGLSKTYTISAPSAFTLKAGESYAIYVGDGSSTNYGWNYPSTQVAPSGEGATYNKSVYLNGASWSSSSINGVMIQIDATAVPEPGPLKSVALVGSALMLYGICRRQNGRTGKNTRLPARE